MERLMTLPTTATDRARRGFSLIELLVVIGIILLLLGLLLPMVLRAIRSGERTRAASELQSIAAALESYYQSFGDYPRSSDLTTFKGSQVLLEALISPRDDDGQAGPGFRKRGNQGPVYGPYLPPEKFKYSTVELQDGFGNAILYIPARPQKPNINTAQGYVWDSANALYDTRYIESGKFTNLSYFRYMMGDVNNNGGIDAGEQPAYTGAYLLWSAGPDGLYGPSGLTPSDASQCDDVTSFR